MHAILALCLLGFVAAQVPQPCVTPKQWEANFFEANEQRGFTIRGRLSYDAVYHRERIIEQFTVGQQERAFEIIVLFDLNIEYVYDFTSRNCTHRALSQPWRDFGIPPNARSLGEAYIGSSALPSGNILATLWRSNYTGPANDSVSSFGTWTYLNCLPVRIIEHSSRFGRTDISFYDIVAGISNPSVFIPRPECLTEQDNAHKEVFSPQVPPKILP